MPDIENSNSARGPSAAPGAGTIPIHDGSIRALLTPDEREVERILTICNACRYCEGFCAVFPAMERRLQFGAADIHFLASLCHNCGACLHSCQYAPPNAFAVNVPRAMARAREESYERFAWPAAFGALYRRQGAWTGIALALALAGFMLALSDVRGDALAGTANFYAVVPHRVLVGLFGAVSLWIALAIGVSVVRFWKGLPTRPGAVSGGDVALETARHVLALTYLEGGGPGCTEASDAPAPTRRWFHHATFYGFGLCFAATCVATVYHYLFDRPAPYPVMSAPVMLGTVGGILLVIGVVGLAWLNRGRDPDHGDPGQRPMDWGFMVLLLLTSVTGLALLAARQSVHMPMLMAVHLGAVLALFVTLPYGKFMHGVYRTVSLLKDAIEKRQPGQLKLNVD
jgi:citrate/tricarballylate utilization protein